MSIWFFSGLCVWSPFLQKITPIILMVTRNAESSTGVLKMLTFLDSFMQTKYQVRFNPPMFISDAGGGLRLGECIVSEI